MFSTMIAANAQLCFRQLEQHRYHAAALDKQVGLCAGYLALWQQIAGPYLVVVPLSTVPNWIKEFRKWLPQVNALVYVGDSKSREVRHQSADDPFTPCAADHASLQPLCLQGRLLLEHR